jgi:hypothetical protein
MIFAVMIHGRHDRSNTDASPSLVNDVAYAGRDASPALPQSLRIGIDGPDPVRAQLAAARREHRAARFEVRDHPSAHRL